MSEQQQQDFTHVAIPVDTLNKLVGVLQVRPFNEVAGIIEELQKGAKPINLQAPAEVPEAREQTEPGS
jgi:hypothetical protein